tara:strand:- start:35 stop:274 length:240 start_codon:yes stop_codon:yes gene_type:complete
MKESKLLEMQNKIEAQSRVIQVLINEIAHLREISIGTLETIKLMPNYDQAIKDLQVKMEEKQKEIKKSKQNGTIEQNTK